MQILGLGEHNGTGICQCAGVEDDRNDYRKTNPECLVTGHSGEVCAVAISPDGTRIVSGCENFLKIWDATTGAEVSIFVGVE